MNIRCITSLCARLALVSVLGAGSASLAQAPALGLGRVDQIALTVSDIARADLAARVGKFASGAASIVP